MNCVDELKNIPVFSLERNEKRALYARMMNDLVRYHYKRCEAYKRMLDLLGYDRSIEYSLNDIPFIPARLFKHHRFASVEGADVVKTLISSGTTGQSRSVIVLDRENSLNQIRVLARIVSSLSGRKRLPMLVIDSPSVIKDRDTFSARGAGIRGFSALATKVEYALNDDMKLDLDRVRQFSERHHGEPILVFGFTYMIWEYFCKPLMESSQPINLDQAVVLHGGGWKKMTNCAVDNKRFRDVIKKVSGIGRVYDYYGMVEQTGSIFLECEEGYLHSSIYSDVVIRRSDFLVCEVNEPGIVQVMSLLPTSYPGHSLLTEDSGVLLGEDDCSCGRKGKYFLVSGRIESAETRGCSDTFHQ